MHEQMLHADDWPLWRHLRLQALAESPDMYGSTLAEWTGTGDTEERWRQRFSTVPLNIVVHCDGEPAGIVGAYEQPGGAVELISMWVAPAARGRGVGDAAVQAVLDWAGGRDVVLSVKAHNRPAIALYERNGFVDAGPPPDDAGERLMRCVVGVRPGRPMRTR
jgi:ribosomal protein S18 acetylase RimI-like enzyme